MALSVLSDRYSLISLKLSKVCLLNIFKYLPDIDIISAGKVDPKLNEVAHEILIRKRELKFKYEINCKDDILEAIKIAGSNLRALYIEGEFDSELFLVIHRFCTSMKKLEMEIASFERDQNPIELPILTELENLKLHWNPYRMRFPDELKDLMEKSPKLQNLHLSGLNDDDFVQIKFPAYLKGLKIRYRLVNTGYVLRKIREECKEIEKLSFDLSVIQRREDIETLNKLGRNLIHLDLVFHIGGTPVISFLNNSPKLKVLYCRSSNSITYIDLFELLSSIPTIETLHLRYKYLISERQFADVSKLKNFGFNLTQNRNFLHFERFNSLEILSFYDRDYDLRPNDQFWHSVFFKILPQLENAKMIEFVHINYEDKFYKIIKRLTQNRENKIRIRMRNRDKKIIRKEENDKFIIEEWSYEDYEKIHRNIF